MKINNTFKLIILVIVGFAVFQAGVFVYFKSTDMDSAKKSELPSFSKANEANNEETNNENERILYDIERQVYSITTGGISPDSYKEISLQLERLEYQGFESARTQLVKAALEKLNVGGSKKQPAAQNSAPAEKPASPQVAITTTPPAPTQTITPVAPCQSNKKPVFTHHITDISKINYVVPPPTIGAGPSLKTHGYIGTDHVRVPVYAPTDMVLNTGAHFEGGPYWIGFEVSCEVTLRFGHITEPIQAIIDIFPPAPANDSHDQQIKNKISFKAGDLIGYTTGTSAAGNWDIGVYNSTTSNKYKGDATWQNSWVYTTAVCPFDYFTEGIRQIYTSKFSSEAMAGNSRDGESFCQF